MRLSTAITFALTVLLATSTLGAVAAVPSASGFTSNSNPDPAATHQPSLETDSDLQSVSATSEPRVQSASLSSNSTSLPPADPAQVIRIQVQDDGDAHWSIESRFLLIGEEGNETFDEWSEAVVSGQRSVGYDAQSFQTELEAAEETTGREMAIGDAGWDEPRTEPLEPETEADLADDIDVENETVRVGVVSYSFTWENFATADEERIYFGDAFDSPDGTWFPSLTSDQRLVIESPDNYALETPTHLVWDGPHHFEDGELEIVFVRGAAPLTGADWYLASALAVLTIGIIVYVIYRLYHAYFDDDSGPDNPPVAAAEAGDSSSSQPANEPSTGSGVELQHEAEPEDDIDPELLSDEERVRRLLKQNGGRMKQASIVTETGWSNAKVSQLLSKMDENGEIEKLRIGRENLITLPDVDPVEMD
ncbi:helix-turn-helix transcriptional regulator [Natronobacterium texcoconense]|uniref:IclR helix-turn-helix domain-containing protein n=1 Tax=Natronobacterium texcoconense TaxID=1095778 RepID=A0A1H1I9T3_NATTX|nr:hypothetical protein [Natronobacterium texcoconense]SDR34377.1 hypothetical protein SAMN04489842_3338 [Natronobacterium texcoconense]